MNTHQYALILPGLSLLLLTSCSSYNGGIQPLSPPPSTLFMMNNDRPPVKTDSLQPTLTWKSLGMTESKYDLVIYTGIARGQNALMGQRGYYIPGIEAYYKEGIDGCSHHVEKPLEPKTVYVWSVRTRNGSSIGQWAKYEVQAIGESWNNLWWDFRTPN